MPPKDAKSGINIPGVMLDELREKGLSNDRPVSGGIKRKAGQLSRKDQRKSDRQAKKQKRVKPDQKADQKNGGKGVQNHASKVTKPAHTAPKKPVQSVKPTKGLLKKGSGSGRSVSFSGEDQVKEFDDGHFDESGDGSGEEETAEDVFAKLKAAKAKKSKPAAQDAGEMSVADTMAALKAKKAAKSAPKEDMSVEETMAALKAKKSKKSAPKAKDSEMTAEETMAALMAKKAGKKAPKSSEMSVEDTMAALKAKKAGKDKKEKKEPKKEPKKERHIDDFDKVMLKKDEDEMDYYAKKLGFKNAKSAKFDDDDELGLGGILDGLDLDYGFDEDGFSEDDIPELVAESKSKKDKKEKKEKKEKKVEEVKLPWSDDELDSDDFDSDLDEDLEGLEDEDEDMDSDEDEDEDEDMDSDMDSDDDESEDEKPVKENPYVAPVAADAKAKYIPPSLRKKLAESTESEEMVKLRRTIKGLLNKLSESNIGTIVNDLLNVFNTNPRQHVTSIITKALIDSTAIPGALLESYLVLHAALATMLYRTIGISFGAFFVQTLVEEFQKHYDADNTKECSNLLSFLTEIYYFQMISCKLIYDLIRTFLETTGERNTEYLLKIVRYSGSQLRSDDPSALKQIIGDLQSTLAKTDPKSINARTKFLVESVTALKNNRQSNNGISEATTESKLRLKKFLGTFSQASAVVNEPISVSLDDIRSVETRGKWWLVGAAWKNQGGNGPAGGADEEDFNQEAMHDILDAAEPNWLELAREQRMNTDIRRAVFVALMGSEDYLNAMERISKLRLRRVQEREIPRVLIHCCSNETVFNPFYALVAAKLCERHSLKMTFQFTLWDFFRELEGEESDSEDESEDEAPKLVDAGTDSKELLRKIMNLARMFALMTGEGAIGLSIFKNINFLTASENMRIFLEMYFVTLFNLVGKKAEEASTGMKNGESRDQRPVVALLAKLTDNQVLLRGIQYFVSEVAVKSDLIVKKKQKERVFWAVDIITDVVDEFSKSRD